MIRDKLILALDVSTREEALALVERLHGYVGGFKVGLQLFHACGPAILHEVRQRGGRVFYDGKFHDIPHTVAGAVAEVTQAGVFMLNVHTHGGAAMMRAAVESAQQVAAARGQPRPLILGVTVLTSLDATALGEELQIPVALPEHVVHLARLAQRSGLDGVVASPRETLAVRAACGGDFLIVTPGIRPAWAAPGDQKRVTTPAQALRAGADYLVVGRPIIAHADPVAAAQRVLEEMAEA